MTTMNKEKLMEKVQKLLALAGNNPSQEEANAAYLKAQKLIAQYNLDMTQVGEEVDKIVTKLATHRGNCGYRTKLAVVLAENFRCQAMMHGNTVMFIGYEADVEICTDVFNHAYSVIYYKTNKLEAEARANFGTAKGVTNSYAYGFIQGVKEVLDEQCTALMIVVPEEVKDYVNNRSSKKPYKGGMRDTGFNSKAYASGFADGKEHMGRKHIEG